MKKENEPEYFFIDKKLHWAYRYISIEEFTKVTKGLSMSSAYDDLFRIDLSKKKFRQFKKNRKTILEYAKKDKPSRSRSTMSGYSEEINWFTNSAYTILAEYDYLYYSKTIKWHVGSEVHISPDFLLTTNEGKTIGIELVCTRPTILIQKHNSEGGIDIPSQLIHQWRDIPQKQAILERIDKKIKKALDGHYVGCDELFLIINTNPEGTGEEEKFNKLYNQLMVDKYYSKQKKKPFKRILIS